VADLRHTRTISMTLANSIVYFVEHGTTFDRTSYVVSVDP
jgi:hypothetical protein